MRPRTPLRPRSARELLARRTVRSALFRLTLPPGLARHAGLPVLARRTPGLVVAPPGLSGPDGSVEAE